MDEVEKRALKTLICAAALLSAEILLLALWVRIFG